MEVQITWVPAESRFRCVFGDGTVLSCRRLSVLRKILDRIVVLEERRQRAERNQKEGSGCDGRENTA